MFNRARISHGNMASDMTLDTAAHIFAIDIIISIVLLYATLEIVR